MDWNADDEHFKSVYLLSKLIMYRNQKEIFFFFNYCQIDFKSEASSSVNRNIKWYIYKKKND